LKRSAFVAGLALLAGARPRSCAASSRRFRVAVDALGSGLDPYRDAGSDVDRYAWIYGDGLTDGQHVPRPSLAELPERREKGLVYRYTVRGATWHDGRPLRADDVARALRGLHETVSPWLTYEPYSLIDDVAVRPPGVFEVRLHRPSPSFVRTFFSPYGHPALPLLRHDADAQPIGTGPFRLVRRSADRYSFEAYTGSPRGAPASAALDVRLVPSSTTLGVELAAGEVDLVLPIVRGLPGSDRYHIVSRHAGTIVMLFNCDATFRTAELRRAVLRALDVDALQRTIDPGIDARTTGLLPPGERDDATFPFPARDVERARRELRGVTVPVTIVYLAESRRYARLALLLRQMLRDAGLTVEIAPRPQAMYQTALGPLRTGRFDLAVSGLPYDEQPDLAADWSCATIPPRGANYARFCDPVFERELTHASVRDALRTLMNRMPLIPLARSTESFGIGPNAIGFDAPPPFVPPTLSAQRWALRDAQ
jgi:peptide/nickel transport system substrate-binding protein